MTSRLDCIKDWDREAREAHFCVATLAKRCRATDRQLRRYFRQQFGQSPHAWMAGKRLENARVLLANGALIKEIACEAGFSNPQNFSRQFKEHYKLSPRDLRATDRELAEMSDNDTKCPI